MNSKVINNKQELPYPKLMQNLDDQGFIILFFNEYEGVVVSQDTDADWDIGEVGRQFISSDFKDFNGKIELSNG